MRIAAIGRASWPPRPRCSRWTGATRYAERMHTHRAVSALRARRRTRLVFLAALVTPLLGCSSGSAEPRELALVDLKRFAERYDGERVAATGVVQRFEDPLHYWIEGPKGNRVAIVPVERVREHLDSEVRVVGAFTYDRTQGRRIEPESVTPLD